MSTAANPSKEGAGHGVAQLKPEYILHDYKPTLDTDFVSESVKEQLDEANQETNDDEGGPPTKRIKLKGRNKQRPKGPKVDLGNKLCPALIQDKECSFGEKCKFSHDREKFVQSKPKDIADTCYLYTTYGKCPYGIACRFGSGHITDELTNKINPDHTDNKREDTMLNVLPKQLQTALWKRKYDFSRSDVVLDKMGVRNMEQRRRDKLTEDGKARYSEIYNSNWTIADVPTTEKKKIDFSNKLYLAPLTTVGNLPFRRVCKQYGVDITCGEMAMCTNLLQGQQSEWALLKRHQTEDIFGVQLCGGYPDSMTRCAQLICETMKVDFIDINCGCPIDLVFNKGEGSALMGRQEKLESIVRSMTSVMNVPLTVKLRTGIHDNKTIAHQLAPRLRSWGVALTTLHGRSRVQRYTKVADWDYINKCAEAASPMPLFGNGDILSFEEANLRRSSTGVSGLMVARGALIKPWIFTEIKEQRHWDISSSERLDMLKNYVNYGLEHWGSDDKGVANTRRFLLEWLSFLYRYIPVGLLERVPQHINERPPYYKGRDDLETLMASPNCGDWIKISEMLLGPVPEGFTFLPKHKANAYK